MRSSASRVAEAMKRWLLHSLSHIGWCQLKLPHHSMESVAVDMGVLCSFDRSLSTAVIESEWVQSLYILKMIVLPWGCFIWITVMSFVPLSITWDQELVSSLVLTSVTARFGDVSDR